MLTYQFISLAIDTLSLKEALELTKRVGESYYAIKLHVLFDKYGIGAIADFLKAGARKIWLDIKLHDTPETVRARARVAKEAGVHTLTVHASSGVETMRAAVEDGPPEIYAVTVPTSISEQEAHVIYNCPVDVATLKLAMLAKLAGVNGIVCSPKEAGMVSRRFEGLKVVTPGIRLLGEPLHEQKRVGTAYEAISSGASDIVLGRMITLAKDPEVALRKVMENIAKGVRS